MKWRQMGTAIERTYLPNGDFVDRAKKTYAQFYGYKYGAWRPGVSPTGCAGWLCGANTLEDLRAKYEETGEHFS